jgi:hypothetical protein
LPIRTLPLSQDVTRQCKADPAKEILYLQAQPLEHIPAFPLLDVVIAQSLHLDCVVAVAHLTKQRDILVPAMQYFYSVYRGLRNLEAVRR